MRDENEHGYYNFTELLKASQQPLQTLNVIRLICSETIRTTLFNLTLVPFYYFAAVSEYYLTPLAGRWLSVLPSVLLVVFLLLATLYVHCGDSGPVT